MRCRCPAGLSLSEAACLPETCFTVWSNVVMRGGLQAGERFLVHGGSSGIGTTAIQIATAWARGSSPRPASAEKCAACERLGAERRSTTANEDFVEVLEPEGGADLILDMVGGDYIPRNLKALADDGRLVFIAFLRGPKADIELRADHGAAADADRIDPAAAVRPGQGADRRGAARAMSGRWCDPGACAR